VYWLLLYVFYFFSLVFRVVLYKVVLPLLW
jgi:hypothetical protein